MGHAMDAHKSRARSIRGSQTDGSNSDSAVCGTVTVEPENGGGDDPEPDPDDGSRVGTRTVLLGAGALGAVGVALARRR